MLHFIEGFFAGCLVWLPAGMYAWYRWGSNLKAKEQQIATQLSTFGNKPSGK